MPRNQYTPKLFTVYFFQVGTLGPIKIGRTACDPWRRLDAIQGGNHEPLRFVAQIAGVPESAEQRIHKHLRQHRIRREWFHPHADVLNFIDRHGQKPYPAGLPYPPDRDPKELWERWMAVDETLRPGSGDWGMESMESRRLRVVTNAYRSRCHSWRRCR